MKKSFWIFLILAAALVIFSVQNADPVVVDFFFKKVSISLAVLLIVVFLIGVIAGASYFFLKSRVVVKNKAIDEEEGFVDETINIDAKD